MTGSCPIRTRLDITLRRMRLDADVAMLDVPRDLDARGIAGALIAVLFPERVRKPEPRKPTVVEVARRYADMKQSSTRDTYLRTIIHVERFRPEATLDEVGREWLTGLPQNYPFRKFKIKNGEDEEAGAPGGGVASVAPGA